MSIEQVEVYKVVRKTYDPDVFTSCIVNDFRRRLYKLGEACSTASELSAWGYHLTCFQSLSLARRFALGKGNLLVLLCTVFVKDIVDMPEFRKPARFHTSLAALLADDDCNWPSGTIMCRKLTPIAIVD